MSYTAQFWIVGAMFYLSIGLGIASALRSHKQSSVEACVFIALLWLPMALASVVYCMVMAVAAMIKETWG